MYRSQLLDFDGWKSQNLPISSTASQEAVKLYDAALAQFVGLYDDPNFGGLSNTLEKIYQSDPDFILGNSFSLCAELFGYTKSYYHDDVIKVRVDELDKQSDLKKDEITLREYKHAKAAVKFAKMDWQGAGEIWESITQDHPTDFHALKMAYYKYFFSGEKQKHENLIIRVYPHFEDSSVLYSKYVIFYYLFFNEVKFSYIDGSLAFALEENMNYSEAEKYAKLGLSKNPYDAWATHALAHVYEMQGRFKEGVDFMTSQKHFWSKSNHLTCHNSWHQSLFNISTDNFDEAFNLFDNEIMASVRSTQTPFSIADSSSFLVRLSLIDTCQSTRPKFSLDSRFKDVYAVSKQYHNLHILGFNDAHFLMSYLGSGHINEAREFLEDFKKSPYEKRHPKSGQIMSKLLEAMIAYEEHRYEESTELLVSIKDSLFLIGGSDAQRDIFNMLAITSAMKSGKESHKKLLQELLLERESFKPNDKFIGHITC